MPRDNIPDDEGASPEKYTELTPTSHEIFTPEILLGYNLFFKAIMETILDTFKLSLSPLSEKIRSSFALTFEEIEVARKDQRTLKSTVSSAIGRNFSFDTKTIPQIVSQLYWLKLSGYIGEIIAESTVKQSVDHLKSEPENLFLAFGLARMLANTFSREILRLRTSAIEELESHSIVAEWKAFYQERPCYLFGPPYGLLRSQKTAYSSSSIIPIHTLGYECSLEELLDCNGEGGFSKEKFDGLKKKIDEEFDTVRTYQHQQVISNVKVYSSMPIDDTLLSGLKQLISDQHLCSIKEKIIIHNGTDDHYLNIIGEGDLRKYYLSCDKNKKYELFSLGRVLFNERGIMCTHNAAYFKLWTLLSNKYFALSQLAQCKETSPAEFLQKLGEFCFFYINVMPYRGGSAAIGEWIMQGLTKAKGIALGEFNHAELSWDFDAFATLASAPYGKNFSHFFKTVSFINETKSVAQSAIVQSIIHVGLFKQNDSPSDQKPGHNLLPGKD